jgi:general secretion pathway protein M
MLSGWVEVVLRRWRMLSARERRLLALTLLVAGVAFLYLFAFEPAWQGRATLVERLPKLREQLASVERITHEARSLETAVRTPAQSIQAVRIGVERSIDGAGLRDSLRRLQINGAVIDLEFRQAPFGDWIEWLDSTVREQRLRVVDLSLNRDAGGQRVSGRLLLEHAQDGAVPGARR